MFPYHELKNEDVVRNIERGYRLPRPPLCPLGLYPLMRATFQYEPTKRPTFAMILARLRTFQTDVVDAAIAPAGTSADDIRPPTPDYGDSLSLNSFPSISSLSSSQSVPFYEKMTSPATEKHAYMNAPARSLRLDEASTHL